MLKKIALMEQIALIMVIISVVMNNPQPNPLGGCSSQTEWEWVIPITHGVGLRYSRPYSVKNRRS